MTLEEEIRALRDALAKVEKERDYYKNMYEEAIQQVDELEDELDNMIGALD